MTENMLSNQDIMVDVQIAPEEIPEKIDSKVATIEELESKINDAIHKAKEAKDNTEAANKKVKVFHKKKAIEDLQKALVSQSEALLSETDAISKMLENEKQLGEMAKELFVLGISNIGNIRAVINAIVNRLEDASKETLSENAKKELLNIVKQLKAHEDLHNRIEKNSLKITELSKSTSQTLNDLKIAVGDIQKKLGQIDVTVNDMNNHASRGNSYVDVQQKNSFGKHIPLLALIISIVGLIAAIFSILVSLT